MGGLAITNSSRVPQSLVPKILERMKSILTQLEIYDFDNVGSAGKKEPEQTSGDIDIVVNQKVLNKFETLEVLAQRLYSFEDIVETRILKGFNMISIGLQLDENIYQVDIIPVPSVDFARWSMFSPFYTVSKYKSGVRNSLIYWTLSERYHEPIEIDSLGMEVTWKRIIFDHNIGAVRLTQTIKGKKGYLANKKTVLRENLDWSTSILETKKHCWGSVAESCPCETVEQCWTCLRQCTELSEEQKRHIINNVIEECEIKHFEYPEEFNNV